MSLACHPDLSYWYAENGWSYCRGVLEESQEIGHNIHLAMQIYLETGNSKASLKKLGELEIGIAEPLIEWCSKNKVDPITLDGSPMIERSLFSEALFLGGTPDLVAFVNGKLSIVDWKTDSDSGAKRERKAKYLYQASGYALILAEKGIEAVESHFVRSSKKGKHDVYSFTEKELKEAKKEFLELRKIYRRVKGN